MNRVSHLASLVIAIAATLLAFAATPSLAPAQLVRQYEILPGGRYTYLPSPEGPGIPGCDPSTYECAFSLAGQFSLEFSSASIPRTVRFTNLDFTLGGNEDIQNNPPNLTPVTSDRVEAWLAGRILDQVPVGAPIDFYQDNQLQSLGLSDFLNGTVGLSGGYDLRPVDGDGLNFQFAAQLIPEPSTFALVSLALASLLLRARQPTVAQL